MPMEENNPDGSRVVAMLEKLMQQQEIFCGSRPTTRKKFCGEWKVFSNKPQNVWIALSNERSKTNQRCIRNCGNKKKALGQWRHH